MNGYSVTTRKRFLALALLLLTLANTLCGSVWAAETGDTLRYSITPYLWATRMKGDVKAGRLPETSLDMKFSDILETLDFGFMTAIEIRKGRFGFLFDGLYMNVADSSDAQSTDGSVTVSADAEVKQTMLAFAAAWRVWEERFLVDAVGGVRYNKIEFDADIDATLFGEEAGSVGRSGDKDWVDPYVGLRLVVPVGGGLSLVGYVDAGGFGVGSDFTWQGLAGLEYAMSESFIASVGYRYMKIDYDQGGFRYDMANDGLYAGMTMAF
jgi:opacity protein-like surface antigen